jgi:hypothetical protein
MDPGLFFFILLQHHRKRCSGGLLGALRFRITADSDRKAEAQDEKRDETEGKLQKRSRR